MLPQVPFLILLWEPQATSQKVSQHPPPAGIFPVKFWWAQLVPGHISCKFFNTLCWQLDSFLVNFLPTHLSLIYDFFGKKKTIACHSWFTVLCLTSSNHQCSKGRFLACQSWFVVFNPPDCWSALIKHSSTNIYVETQAQLNKYICWNPYTSTKSEPPVYRGLSLSMPVYSLGVLSQQLMIL